MKPCKLPFQIVDIQKQHFCITVQKTHQHKCTINKEAFSCNFLAPPVIIM